MNVLAIIRNGSGTRLRKLKKKTKGLGGRLTDSKIDTLQNYFGIALRMKSMSEILMQ